MKTLFACVLTMSFLNASMAQPFADSVTLNNQLKQAISYYDNAIGGQADIYNGEEYTPYLFKTTGIPFFNSETLKVGWVSYKGRVYNPLQIQYDVHRDQLVIMSANGYSKIVLDNKFVDSFYFSGQTFTKIKATASNNLPSSEFYNRLYNGTHKVLVIRKKSMREIIEYNRVVRVFDVKDRFFVWSSGNYIAVKNKKEVLSLFRSERRKIVREIRKKDVSFRKEGFEKALLLSVQLYDQSAN